MRDAPLWVKRSNGLTVDEAWDLNEQFYRELENEDDSEWHSGYYWGVHDLLQQLRLKELVAREGLFP